VEATVDPHRSQTPFRPSVPQALGFDLLRYAELVAARDESGADRREVLARFGIDSAAHEQIETYWRGTFEKQGLLALEFGRLVLDAKKRAAERREHPRLTAVGTGTLIGNEEGSASTSIPVPAPPDLTVQQYAWLVAELRKTLPSALSAALERLRLTPQTRKDLEEQWSKRMAADPALRELFLTALNKHLTGVAG
jgi:hypothetical protein